VELRVDEFQEEESSSRGDYFSIALFHDGGDGLVDGFEFQRCVGGIYGHPDTGTPPYCTVTANHQTFYGGIEQIEWFGMAVDFDFSEEARGALQLSDTHLSIVLSMAEDDAIRVKTALGRVFAGGGFQYSQPNLVGFS
jgi:hypothetical protein